VNAAAKRYLRGAAKSVFATADLLRSDAPGPRILIYHQIDAGLGREMEVTLEAFESHIAWLAANYRVVGLEEAITRRSEPDASRMVVISFDDGYEDVHRLAFPRLRESGLPFTLYLTTEPIESQRPLRPGGRADPLTWDQINTMISSGLVTVGAHTHTHPDLRGATADQAIEELETSNQLLGHRTGVSPRHFTYPWGRWSEAVDPIVRRCYQSATLGSGPPITGTDDPYLLHRIPIQLSDGVFFFRRKLTTGMRLEDRVRRVLNRYRGP
jgi:peptidoglycan/xylan/chitin deacetylase (PgdA/CDA1 family)